MPCELVGLSTLLIWKHSMIIHSRRLWEWVDLSLCLEQNAQPEA